MGHPVRHVYEGGVYHVMNRGAARQSIFADDADRVEFGRLLAEVHERFDIEVLAYCLMGNHYHVLLRCPEGGLSEGMQHLSSVYTRHANERSGRDGPLFRSRFRSLLVDSDRYLLAAVRYIHRNPLDIAGIESVDRYRWSSHRAYLGLRRCPDFLVVDDVLACFGHDVDAFDRFVRGEVGSSCPPPGVEQLRHLAWLAVQHVGDGDEIRGSGVERTILLLLADHLDGGEREWLLESLGLPPGGPRRSAMARARRRRRESADLRLAVDVALAQIGSVSDRV